MPMTSAARRASRASSSVQQPRAPVRYELGLLDNARCTPVTSRPASAARAAATAESTPPDMAASTRMLTCPGPVPRPLAACSPARPPGPLNDLADDRAERGHVLLGARAPQREPQRAARPRLVGSHGEQHMAWLRHPGRAGRPGRAGDPPSVQQHEQRIALAAGEREVGVAGQPLRSWFRAIEYRVWHFRAYPVDQQ